MLYRGAVEWSKALVFRVLRIMPGTQVATHTLRLAVFAITTGIHLLIRQFARSKCSSWEDEVYWWSANFVGMILEGYFSAYVLRFIHKMPDGRTKRWALKMVNVVGPWVGRLWVFVFLVWSVGKQEYNKYECYYGKRANPAGMDHRKQGLKNKTDA
jgi:hypothetical protein